MAARLLDRRVLVDHTTVVSEATVGRATRPSGRPSRRGDTDAVPTRVLVFGMAHEDGTIKAGELFPVAEACGQSGEQVRSCLRRVTAEGLVVRTGGSGTATTYRVTAAGMAALGATLERTRLAYGQDAAGRGWDRQWRLVALRLPDPPTTPRRTLRCRCRPHV